MVELGRVTLSPFEAPDEFPPISHAEYLQRLDEARACMERDNLDFLLVYGDREHFANMAYLTGFDPRFEEALLLLDRSGGQKLLVGNECMGYLPAPRLGIEIELFQEFSLLGQPRDGSRPFRRILAEFGIGRGATIGCAGWKYFDTSLVSGPLPAMEIPSYIVDCLRELSGDPSKVPNSTSLFMNPRDGLRIVNSADQIAQFEFAASHCSQSVLSLLRSLREGSRESDLERHLAGAGLPLSCHRMISFGEKAKRGLSSPSQNRASQGDPYTVAFGVQGALVCRAGVIAHSAQELPAETHDFYPRFAANYFEVVAEWYSQVKVGALGGAVFAAVEARRDPSLYDFAVNPGHYIHLDEWVSSPFLAGSDIALRSGMALQMDIIPISKGPFCYANMEDGIVLADETLRSAIAREHPAAWSRIQRRRKFMTETIGIPLDESVLPLSNICGWMAPYILEPDMAFIHRGG